MPEITRLVTLLREQAGHCRAGGSPLYESLLTHAADDAAARGPTFELLHDDPAPGIRGDALGLRLLAAAHRLALEGAAPELAAELPSTRAQAASTSGPTPDPAATDLDRAWSAFRSVIATRRDLMRPLVARPCQTNEVGRSASLSFGHFVAARAGLPLRLLEVGASAGLNLRFEHFRFGGGGASWGPPESPVDLTGLWLEAPDLPQILTVAERHGCDRRPVDPGTEDGRLALLSSVWADQLPRFGRLRGALEVARRVPATVEQADIGVWLPAQVAAPRPGLATVVYHSIVDEYLPEATRTVFHTALRDAGARATRDAPLYWVRLEPFDDQRRFGVTVTSWPGGEERLVALSGAHGSDVRRA